ncbi:unnamed protein product [Paramecium octaurelia]|uniref:Uncharacterized protein n=1 Tax=Paramecium octaurelia TaxID=43137 RepID=A0A8S1VMA8_PAROT|nr:unnamed protein product [Paramecium octaurelia]
MKILQLNQNDINNFVKLIIQVWQQSHFIFFHKKTFLETCQCFGNQQIILINNIDRKRVIITQKFTFQKKLFKKNNRSNEGLHILIFIFLLKTYNRFMIQTILLRGQT